MVRPFKLGNKCRENSLYPLTTSPPAPFFYFFFFFLFSLSVSSIRRSSCSIWPRWDSVLSSNIQTNHYLVERDIHSCLSRSEYISRSVTSTIQLSLILITDNSLTNKKQKSTITVLLIFLCFRAYAHSQTFPQHSSLKEASYIYSGNIEEC